MSIEQFISVFSLIIACIALGYTIGKDINNKQKQPPQSGKLSDYFSLQIGLTVYRQCLLLYDNFIGISYTYCTIFFSEIQLKCVLDQMVVHQGLSIPIFQGVGLWIYQSIQGAGDKWRKNSQLSLIFSADCVKLSLC